MRSFLVILTLALLGLVTATAIPHPTPSDNIAKRCKGPCGQTKRDGSLGVIPLGDFEGMEVGLNGKRCKGPCGQGKRDVRVGPQGVDVVSDDTFDPKKRCKGPCGQTKREEPVEENKLEKKCKGPCGQTKRESEIENETAEAPVVSEDLSEPTTRCKGPCGQTRREEPEEETKIVKKCKGPCGQT